MQFIIKGSVFTSFFYVSLDMLIQTSTAARVLFLQNDIWQLIRSLYVKLPIQLTIALIKTLINFSAVVTKTNLFSVRFQLYRVCLQDNRLCQKTLWFTYMTTTTGCQSVSCVPQARWSGKYSRKYSRKKTVRFM